MRRATVFFLAGVIMARPGFSAVAEHAHSAIQSSTSEVPISIQWTQACDGDSALVVVLRGYNTDAAYPVDVSSSLDGALTLAESALTDFGSEAYVYYLTSPSDGTHTITVAYNENYYPGLVSSAVSITLTGSDTTSPIEDTWTSTGSGSPVSSGVLDGSSGSLAIDIISTTLVQPEAAAGQTVVGNNTVIGVSEEAETTGMGWTLPSGAWAYCGIIVKAASAEPEASPTVRPSVSDFLIRMDRVGNN